MRGIIAAAVPFAVAFILAAGASADQVASPTFDPAPGSYQVAQMVTISCATEGAQIRYTSDGTQPGPASTLYTDPMEVSSTTQFIAYATREGLDDSDAVSAQYRIDNQGPAILGLLTVPTQVRAGVDTSINIIAVANDSSRGGSTIVAAEYFTGADPGEGNGTPMEPSDGTFDSSAEAINKVADCSAWTLGTVTIQLRACDAAGNWGSTSSKTVSVVEGVPPGAITDLKAVHVPSLQPYTSSVDSFSSEAPGHAATNLVDASNATFWQSVGTVTSQTEYVILDLGTVAEVQGVLIYPYALGKLFPREFNVLVSQDKISWINVCSVQSFKVSRTIYLWQFDVTSARYVKLTAKGVRNPADGRYAVQVAGITPCFGGSALLRLGWTAPGDDGYAGDAAAAYEARYSTESVLESNWSKLPKATGLGTPKAPDETESALVSLGVVTGHVQIAIKACDEVPNWSALSNTVDVNAVTITGFVSVAPDDLADAGADVIPTFRFVVEPLVKPAAVAFSGSPSFPAVPTPRPDGGRDTTCRIPLKAGAGQWTPSASQWKLIKSLASPEGTLYWRLEGSRLVVLGIYGETRALLFDTGFVTFLTVSPSHDVGGDECVWPDASVRPTWSWTDNTSGMEYFWVDISTDDIFPMADKKKTISFAGAAAESWQPLAVEWKKIRALAATSGGTVFWRVRAKDADRVLGCVSMVKTLVMDGGEWSVSDLDLSAPSPEVTWTHTGDGLVNYSLVFSTEAAFPNTARKTLRMPGKPVTGASYVLTASDVARLGRLAAKNGVTTLYYRVRGEDAERAFLAYSEAKTVTIP